MTYALRQSSMPSEASKVHSPFRPELDACTSVMSSGTTDSPLAMASETSWKRAFIHMPVNLIAYAVVI